MITQKHWRQPPLAAEQQAKEQEGDMHCSNEMRAHLGWKRHVMRLLTPLVRAYANRQAAYRNSPGRYADPCDAIRAGIDEPRLDSKPQ